MAKLPAHRNPNRPQSADEVLYNELKGLISAVRDPLFVFLGEAQRGNVPESHIVNRLLSPLTMVAAELRRREAQLTTAALTALARADTGDNTLDLSVEVPAFIAALDAAAADVKAAAPAMFDAEGAARFAIVINAQGRPVSKNTLTTVQLDALVATVEGVLVRVTE